MGKLRNKYYSYIKNKILLKDVCDELGIMTKRTGNDFICSCIFHSETNPSMHIRTDKNTFYCYGCGKSGDLFTILKQKLNCSLQESVEWIEKTYPWVLDEKPVFYGNESESKKKSGYVIAYKTYEDMSETEKLRFQEYAKKRRYSAEFLLERGIFFASGRKLCDTYIKKADDFIEEMDLLQDTFLIKALPLGKGHIDVHYKDFCEDDRIIITLRNESGEIIGFAGRSLRDDERGFKYLFTKKLPKSSILYRLDWVRSQLIQIKKENKKDIKICIVEGMFDALRLESMGGLAVAIMGSRLLANQAVLLGRTIKSVNADISLVLYLDSDEAGRKGTVESIKNIWKNDILRCCYLTVAIRECDEKDPDEAYENGNDYKTVFYTAFEFLMRYQLAENGEKLAGIQIEERYENISAEKRIRVLRRIEDILTQKEWDDVFAWYDIVFDASHPKEEILDDAMFAYQVICRFIKADYHRVIGKQGKGAGNEKSIDKVKKSFHYHMQTALQIARTSYGREEISLDESSWERIALGSDAVFEYLYESLKRHESIQIPMIMMKVPKKLGVPRRKALYCHEELVLQQYILNELLSEGTDENYEKFVPAVRYRKERGICLTGYGYWDVIKENVSFAYQIDMSVIDGSVEIKNGMFRPFYDCWKSYIDYIQDGIEKLKGKRVYRVKLDIEGFYDNIRRFVIRDALYEPILQALRSDEDKFECFGEIDAAKYERADDVVNWILNELFKEDYYDPGTGRCEQKGQDNCGIPQGPDLSAYAANVALFSVDKKVWEIIERVNRNCNENEINARYARYVDDMIVIASSPKILMEIKSVIAEQLYDIGLNLSPKTDDADGITKEEAADWTLEERGGFGVSAGFDMPDDIMDSLMEEYEEYEVTDRRGALKLLQGNLYSLLYEGIEKEETDFEALLGVVFQTEEIRYRDIARFSEMILFYAGKMEDDILTAFKKIWEQGKKKCRSSALFMEDGLYILAFLDGCRGILKRRKQFRTKKSSKKWESVEYKIQTDWEQVNSSLITQIDEYEILKTNRWMIKFKILEIQALLEKDLQINHMENQSDHEYWYRWQWHVAKKCDDQIALQPKSENLLQDFQYCIAVFLHINGQKAYQDLRSRFQNYRRYNKAVSDNALTSCFKIWFHDGQEGGLDRERKQSALRILLNTLSEEYRAEVIDRNLVLKQFLLFDRADSHIGEFEFLPVYPGVKYPGIMAAVKDGKNSICKIIRTDFIKDEEGNVLEPDGWDLIEQSAENRQWRYEKNLLKQERSKQEIRYVQLADYCYEKDEMSALQCLLYIYKLYPMLSEKLRKTEAQLGKYRKKLIVSKRNVLLALDTNDNILKIIIDNAYLIPEENTSDAVAVEKGEGKYELQRVYKEGTVYWISGYLLKDACHMEKVMLSGRSGEDFYDIEMLKYSLAKLCGTPVQYENKGKRSYEKSIERAIKLIESYLNNEKHKDICLEDAKITNKFISKRIEPDLNVLFDAGLFCSIWAKKYLSYDSGRLLEQLKVIRPCKYDLERRVPKLYSHLADSIYQISCEGEEFIGLKVLSAGLFADCILIHLRMQVLECIHSLDSQQRDRFIKDASETGLDMSIQELELIGKETLVTKINLSLNKIYINLLKAQSEEKGIQYITHLGWLVLLAKICEIDKETGYIVGNTIKREIHRKKITQRLHKVCQIIKLNGKKKTTAGLGYPFEDMDEMLVLWTRDNVIEILNCLKSIDEYYGIKVSRVLSENYSQIIQKKRVVIESEEGNFNELPHFCTFAKRGRNTCDKECNVDDPIKSIYSVSFINGKVAGISTIDRRFGELLQSWEDDTRLLAISGSKGTEDTTKLQTSRIIGKTEENTVTKDLEGLLMQQKRKIAIQIKENIESDMKNQWSKGDDPIGRFYKAQRNMWKRRGNYRFFVNAHRIALFQYKIDSSYQHPEAERCQLTEEMSEIDNEQMDQQMIEKVMQAEGSCAEFRRRELLEKVMEICSDFDVDILLLPEYSVRPETVEWMRNRLEEQKEYKFSIWSGTYRIPAGYNFSNLHIADNYTLNEKIYWHAAPLPVITKNADNKAEVIMKKFKKYPAVTLHEDINPTPAYVLENEFLPVMHQYARDLSGKANRELMPHFFDARDDVIEVICAELFAVASISNYPSFLIESIRAYDNYRNKDNQGKNYLHIEYEDCEKKMMDDIKNFGKHTAIYQRENKYLRTPIILVPACTTRAVDYYIFGQGFYLSAGLKTVFCNAVGTGGRGGSCFIGQDSWDNRKINTNPYLMANTIYHGLKPGIYMQTSEYKDRGALGSKEQALLICDVSPDMEKGQPNAESMLDGLSVVAHIPFFEEKILSDKCMNFSKCRKCNEYEKGLLKDRQGRTREKLNCIVEHCERLSNIHMSYDDKKMLDGDKEMLDNDKEMSYDGRKMSDVIKSMIDLGKNYDSEWFVRRAEYYAENYKLYPQMWMPPALTDWLYAEIDYQKFIENKGDYCIQMPEKK